MSDTLETAYISARLADDDRIHALRDFLYETLPLPGDKYTRRDAHITIIPSFHVAREQFHDINQTLSELDLVGRTVRIEGLGVYPHIVNPRAILLDARIDLADERARLLNTLNHVGATTNTEPSPPHITLFKCDNGYVLEDWRRERLQARIPNHREPWTTELEYVDFVHTTHD